MIQIGFFDVLMAAVMAALAFFLTFYKKVPVEKEIAFGSVRAFVQLVAVGYVLEFIFSSKSIWLTVAAVTLMLLVASYTAGQRAEHFGRGFPIALAAIGTGSVITLGLLLGLNIIKEPEARFIIPLAGMIISNSMNASSIAFNRIGADIKNNRLAIETALALGKTWKQSSHRFYGESIKAGMISILNFLKTVGIVALPGAMTGMILAGADPLEAALFQVVVGFMLLSAVSISAVISAELSIRRFFNSADQFVR